MKAKKILKRLGENLPRRQRAEFKIGQPHVAGRLPRRLDAGEGGAQVRIRNWHAINAHALVVRQQMRRSVAARPIARRAIDRLQIRAGRAFAIGAAHDD